ncbi:BA75_00535T0 [Komagataella pastoris]|uniref:BA75_00535T0 n=1 Tax=Komagataella pastoris TaxID=4922 RepID=A0A1B2J9R0_PICPA|nr:BA75_00535T0 [Komagataella pastoris]
MIRSSISHSKLGPISKMFLRRFSSNGCVLNAYSPIFKEDENLKDLKTPVFEYKSLYYPMKIDSFASEVENSSGKVDYYNHCLREEMKHYGNSEFQDEDRLNNTSSLPELRMIKTKNQAFETYLIENPKVDPKSTVTKMKQYLKFAVMFMKFFKLGVMNVWKNYRLNRKEFYGSYYMVDPKNENAKLKVKNLNSVIDELHTVINCERNVRNANEQRRLHKGGVQDSFPQIELSRSTLQRVLRTRADFIKLPLFAVLFLLLEELTIGLCYIFPEMVPSTCELPQLNHRFFYQQSKSQKELLELRQNALKSELLKKTPYNISSKELFVLSSVLKTKSSLIPAMFYSESYLRQALLRRLKSLNVDNYLIVRDGGVWKMTNLEILRSCIDRGLVDFSKELNPNNDPQSNEQKSHYELIDFDTLRFRLHSFICEMNRSNNHVSVGILGMY